MAEVISIGLHSACAITLFSRKILPICCESDYIIYFTVDYTISKISGGFLLINQNSDLRLKTKSSLFMLKHPSCTNQYG